MSVRMGAISLWISFRIREVRLSGPAALPGFNFESYFETPFIEMWISGIFGNVLLRGRINSIKCFNLSGTSFVNAD